MACLDVVLLLMQRRIALAFFADVSHYWLSSAGDSPRSPNPFQLSGCPVQCLSSLEKLSTPLIFSYINVGLC